MPGDHGDLLFKFSVKSGRTTGVLQMGLHFCKMVLVGAQAGERGKSVETEKVDGRGFITGAGRSTDYLTQKNDFVGMEKFERGRAPVGVVHADHLLRQNLEAAFFLDLTNHHGRGKLSHIGPAPWHTPALI